MPDLIRHLILPVGLHQASAQADCYLILVPMKRMAPVLVSRII